MLDHLGLNNEAGRLMAAIEKVCADGVMTPDVGGSATTRQVTDAMLEVIRGANT